MRRRLFGKGGVRLHHDKKNTQRAIKGNDDAFVKLIGRYKLDLYRTALSYLRNEEEALEAIQEVTYRAYKNIGTVRDAQFVKTWLIRIMINYCIDQLNMKKT